MIQSKHLWLHSKIVDILSQYLPNILEISLLVIIAHYADGPLLVKRIKMYEPGCHYYKTIQAKKIRVYKDFYYILEHSTSTRVLDSSNTSNQIYQAYKNGEKSGQIAFVKGKYSHASEKPTSIAFANDMMFSCHPHYNKIDLFSIYELRYQRSFGESIVHRPVSCFTQHNKLFIVDDDGIKVFFSQCQAFFYTITPPNTMSFVIQGIAIIHDLVYIMILDEDRMATKIQTYCESTFIEEVDISHHLHLFYCESSLDSRSLKDIGYELHSYQNRLIVSTGYKLLLFDSNLQFLSSYSFPFSNYFQICTDDQHFYIYTYNGTLLICI